MKQPTWMTLPTKQNRVAIPAPLTPFASGTRNPAWRSQGSKLDSGFPFPMKPGNGPGMMTGVLRNPDCGGQFEVAVVEGGTDTVRRSQTAGNARPTATARAPATAAPRRPHANL